jgi:hypothetical protein
MNSEPEMISLLRARERNMKHQSTTLTVAFDEVVSLPAEGNAVIAYLKTL